MADILAKIRRLAGEAVSEYGMIAEGDRILAGVSGGKDSMVLLYTLEMLRRKAPVHFELEAATFDPGYPGFDAAGTEKFAADLGVRHHVIRKNMQKIMAEHNALEKPCVLCSRLRRGSLYALGKELRCTKLALGQHLDDIAVSFLISLCRGKGLYTMGPNILSDDGSMRVIRPFVKVEEKMLTEAAEKLALPKRGECIYREELDLKGDRARFKRLLRDLEKQIPGLLQNMRFSLSDIRPGYLLDKRFMKKAEKEDFLSF